MPEDPTAPPAAPTAPAAVPEPVTGGGVLVEERPAPALGDGDHERFAHYVRKDKIVESAVTGAPVRALCGKKWVPGRDPDKFPVCPDCKRIYEGIPGKGKGDDDSAGGGAGAG
ncbi:MAG TPA: DUF3039 domain-containing protein [Candidatus Nanopelagicales bacterium]|jgi:hypothetical protein|nr:DUF3039 domain-containing protein [Candidatus Nanopelagicales bacterium]